ncbi:MAG: ABC transporter ATP-binding protein [Spirochaetales bacterium]|nr:ABC transporter ATP-binding protein [Spirochaetales bacterium]
MSKAEIISVRGLRKCYGAITALDGVSLTVDKGEVFGIVGPNGAGKTTLLECMVGLRKPDFGNILVLGFDPVRQRRRLHECIGVQLQQSALPEGIKVGEALSLFSSLYPHAADTGALLTRWGLEQKRTARFSTLSGGQRQRLFIALALVNDPAAVFLDELTAGLDPEARRASWDLIDDLRACRITIVLVTHAMEEAEALCDRVAIIDHGRLLALDTPDRLIDAAACGSAVSRRGQRRSATLEDAYLAMTSKAAIGEGGASK